MSEKRINDKVIIRKAAVVLDSEGASRIKREMSAAKPLSDLTVRAVEEFLHDYLRAHKIREDNPRYLDEMCEDAEIEEI